MTTVKLTIDAPRSPSEEAVLVARVATAVAEATGDSTVVFELQQTESVTVAGEIAARMAASSRWLA